MNTPSRLIKAVGLVVAFLAVLAAPVTAKTVATTQAGPALSSGVKTVGMDPDMLYATGEGAMPTTSEEPNRARAYLKAKSYAKLDAIANLIQAARGTAINYHARGRDYVGEETIDQEVSGVVDSVQVVSEGREQVGKDTLVRVKVRAPLPERWRNRAAQPSPMPAAQGKAAATLAKAGPSWTALAVRPAAPAYSGPRRAGEAPYTAVIINALGLRVARSMSPKILREGGAEAWGTVKVDYDFVSDHGIVAYAHSLGEAYANKRAGDNPLVLRAVARGGSLSKSDVVVSGEDADYLLSENKRAGFLGEFRVIFVVD